MATNLRPQVVLNSIVGAIDTSDLTHDTVEVTWTATMAHGSLLLADDTEAAIAEAANVVKVIDDPKLIEADYEVGDTVSINVATQGCILNTSALKYSDSTAVVATALTGLEAKLNTFK